MDAFTAFATMQVPALRRDADFLEECFKNNANTMSVYAIAERLFRIHETIEDNGWVELSPPLVAGFADLASRMSEGASPREVLPLVQVLTAVTRALLGDDPGPGPWSGPLAAQMSLGVKKSS